MVIGELFDAVVKVLSPMMNLKKNFPRITIIGQPNVGKSSLMNMLTGVWNEVLLPLLQELPETALISVTQILVSDFILVDTAGLRKKAKVKEDLSSTLVMQHKSH